MPKRIIIIASALTSSLLLAFLNSTALQMGWYFHYPWIDIPMHIIGGFAVGLLVYIALIQAFRYRGAPETSSIRQLYIIVFGTFIVSVIWEILELVLYLTNDAGFSLETLKDIVFGIVGGVLSWSYIQLLPKEASNEDWV